MQSKETLKAPWSAVRPLACWQQEARGSIAARQAAGTLPWIGVNDPSEEQRLHADPAARLQDSANFQLCGPGKLTGAHDPQHTLQKNGGMADQWYVDFGRSHFGSRAILAQDILSQFDLL